MVIFLKQVYDPFHVQVELELLLLLLLLLNLLLLQLLLLLLKLLPPRGTDSRLLSSIRGGFSLFLEVSPPIVLYLIISSSWQASCNCWPPEMFNFDLASKLYYKNMQVSKRSGIHFFFYLFPHLACSSWIMLSSCGVMWPFLRSGLR